MKTIIAGSRGIKDFKVFCKAIKQSNIIENTSLIICGGAEGVDSLAIDYAIQNNIEFKVYPILREDWQQYSKSAGPIRNQIMLTKADCLICIWDGKSRGTFDMFNRWISQKSYLCEIFVIHNSPYIPKNQFFDR